MDWCLDRKLITLALAGALVALAVLTGSELKRELMPRSASGQFAIDAKMPEGTALEITAEVIGQIEQLLLSDDAVSVVFAQIGASEANLNQLLKDSGTNSAQIAVKLKEDRISLEEVYRLSDMVRQLAGGVPGLKVDFIESQSAFEDLLSSEGGSGFVVQIDGDQFEELYRANDQVMAALEEINGLKDIKTSLTRDYPQIEIKMNRLGIDHYGFTLREIGDYLSGGMRGEQATEYKEFDRNIDVRVRFSIEDRENFDRVLATTIRSPTGTPVPLSELLFVNLIKDAKEIRRINQRRVALISANLADKKISEVIPEVQVALNQLALPRGLSVRIAGEQEGIKKSFGQLALAFILSGLLVYMIMAGQFESLRFPFVVIFTLPMGIVGTVFMLYTFDQSINIMSLIGLIVLSGIVVNDAIVKVDFINQERGEGASIRDAVLHASRVRLRPILMTTATTVLALLPMAFGFLPKIINSSLISPLISWLDIYMIRMGLTPFVDLFSPRGAEIQQPLALVVIGGLTVGTLLTLMLIPLLYELFAGRDKQPAAAPPQTSEEPIEVST